MEKGAVVAVAVDGSGAAGRVTAARGVDGRRA